MGARLSSLGLHHWSPRRGPESTSVAALAAVICLLGLYAWTERNAEPDATPLAPHERLAALQDEHLRTDAAAPQGPGSGLAAGGTQAPGDAPMAQPGVELAADSVLAPGRPAAALPVIVAPATGAPATAAPPNPGAVPSKAPGQALLGASVASAKAAVPAAGGPADVAPPGTADASLAAVERTAVLRAGETLETVLASLYVHGEAVHGVIAAYRKLRDPRRLQVGSRVVARFDDGSPLDAGSLREVVVAGPALADPLRIARADADADVAPRDAAPDAGRGAPLAAPLRFVAAEGGALGERTRRVLRCGVSGTLVASIVRCGRDEAFAQAVVRVLAERVDTDEVRAGDELRVVFDELVVAGEAIGVQGLAAVQWRSARDAFTALAWEAEGQRRWVTPEGSGFGRFFLREPVAGARFTSGFGMRMHPILLKMRPHQGIDLAAPAGTPVRAIADGVVAASGRDAVAGRYVRLRHARGYESDSLHLSRVSRDVRPGRRVRRGEVIGAVGSSGRSSGPHLHLGVRRHGAFVDPLSIFDEPALGVAADQREAFAPYARELLALLDAIGHHGVRIN